MLLTGHGRFRTDRVPLDALRRPPVMPLCDISCKSKHNTTSSPRSMPWIAAVDECDNFSKAPKSPQISLLCTPVLSGSYDIWGGTHATNPLNSNTINTTFTAYLTEIHETTCFALQIKRQSSLPTVRRSAKFETLAFDSGITSHSNATGVDTATATPCAKSCATSQLD